HIRIEDAVRAEILRGSQARRPLAANMTGVRPIIPNMHRPRPGAALAMVVGTVMLVMVLLMAANWIVGYTGCSVRNPNGCDYNERYELMHKHPELAGMHKDANGNWVYFDTTTTR